MKVKILAGFWKNAEGVLTGKKANSGEYEVQVNFKQYGLISLWIQGDKLKKLEGVLDEK